MKKALFVTLNVIAVCVTAQEQQAEGEAKTPWVMTFGGVMPARDKPIEDEALKVVFLREVCNRHEPPLNQRPSGWRRFTMQDLVGWYNVPSERMARVLEEIVRERLSYMEKVEGDAKITPRHQTSVALRHLKDFQSPNTLELFKECAVVSKDDRVRCVAVQAYIEVANRDGGIVDFLREVVTEGHLSGMSRYEVYQSLGGIVGYKEGLLAELKAKNKNDDVETLLNFMSDRILVEQEWFGVYQLDSVLCINLDGYVRSIQREQIIQKFVNYEDPEIRNRFGKIKAEIDKIPADQRTDLSQRFKLPPAPQ